MVDVRWLLLALLIVLSGAGCPSTEPMAPPGPVTPQPPPGASDADLAAGLFAPSMEDIVIQDSAPSLAGLASGGSPEPDDVEEKRVAKEAAPVSTGGRTLTAAQVKAVVNSKMPQVRACYEKELKKRDGLRGKVVMSWTIAASGAVSGARVVSNSTRNPTMVPCMIRAVAGWSFPKAEAPFDVEYPFVFKPRDY